MSQATRDRLRGQKQAYKLRLKVERGKATEEDRARLAELERAWGTTGRKAHGRRKADDEAKAARDAAFAERQSAAPVDAEHDQAHDGVTPEAGVDDSSGPAVETPPPPPSFEAPPEAPPRVEVIPKASAGGDWRAKYRAAGGDGREATCNELADLWVAAMKKMGASIRANDGRALISDEMVDSLRPRAVIVADQLLPADFAISPEMEIIGASTVMTAQAAVASLKARKASRVAPARPDPRPDLKVVPSDAPGVPERPKESPTPPEAAAYVPPSRPRTESIYIGPDTVF